MALTKNITLPNNFGENSSFDNAYIRVDRVESTKFLCTASIGYYKEDGLQFLMNTTVSFLPSLDGGNYIKQTYEHLKTLPEFADATDC
jgi:hypothetical protein